MNHDKKLIFWLFNLSTDSNNQILAANLNIIDTLASIAEELIVCSTHVGTYSLPTNVTVIELGGGSFKKRFNALTKILIVTLRILSKRKRSLVFYHMSTRVAAIIGFFLRAFKVPQGLWYSHSVTPLSFQISRHFVNKIFTTAPGTISFKSKKVIYTGHGIRIPSISLKEISTNFQRSGVVSLGRVTPIKRLERILDALGSGKSIDSGICNITFIGPDSTNLKYKNFLKEKAHKLNLQLKFEPIISHEKIFSKLYSFDLYFSGTPSSVDKSLIEAGMMGCLILCENPIALKMTGMDLVYNRFLNNPSPNIESQLNFISKIDSLKKQEIRVQIAEFSRKYNDVRKVYAEIFCELAKLKK